MIVHPSDSRGLADHGWLKSRHTFSFAEYYRPDRMGFGALRVINDDSVAPGRGFDRHPHRDMEIISIPLEGVLEHQDSEGHKGRIKKGEVQIMSAGKGIQHSEYNASSTEAVRFLQIWVLPKKLQVSPHYEQKYFDFKDDALTLLVSPEGEDGSLRINQDAFFTFAKISKANSLNYVRHEAGNGLYLFLINGRLKVNGQELNERDGLGLNEFEQVSLESLSDTEVLLIEVPMLGKGA